MEISFKGAAQTVTGSQTVLKHYSDSILIDCGLYQGPKDLRILNWEKPNYIHDIKSIIITHAHIDHCGLLPRWTALKWKGPIYCTPGTAELMRIMLMDAAKLQEEDAKFANLTKHSKHLPALPLYTQKDAEDVCKLLEPIPFETWFKVTPHMSFRFARAGHILGSAIVQIAYTESNQSRLLTFSGDLGGSHSDLIRDTTTINESDELVLESTYGNRKINFSGRDDRLAEIIKKVIGRSGTLVIPAFALGRTQDLLFSINKLIHEKKIPPIPVYLDSPMAKSITKVYLNNINELQYDPTNSDLIEKSLSPSFFTPIEDADESMMLCMSEEPKIVLSASGMLQGGRVLHHLKHKLTDEKNGILFVGFQGKGTKGRLLQEGILTLRIHHKEIPVEAEIFTIDGYSAHGDSDDIISWLKKFKKMPTKIFLNHGEPESQESFSLKIKQEFPEVEVLIPSINQSYNL